MRMMRVRREYGHWSVHHHCPHAANIGTHVAQYVLYVQYLHHHQLFSLISHFLSLLLPARSMKGKANLTPFFFLFAFFHSARSWLTATMLGRSPFSSILHTGFCFLEELSSTVKKNLKKSWMKTSAPLFRMTLAREQICLLPAYCSLQEWDATSIKLLGTHQ